MNQGNNQITATIRKEEHTLLQSIGLHLLPGILGGLVYIALAGYVKALHFPSILALIIALAFVTTPLELGILIYQSRKKKQELFGEVIQFINPLAWKEYLIWSLIILIGSGAIMTLMGPITDTLAQLFDWLPDYLILDMGLSGSYPMDKLIFTYVLVLIFVVLIVPITEEFYFRGYLLPRIPARLNNWGPLFHSALFALYHVWTPWFFASRTFALLPLIYIVRNKKNIFLGIIAHCLLNSIDFFIGVVFIIQLL